MMIENKIDRMKNGKGFIAALDQSGGSTPKALALYGIHEDAYHSDEEMFQLVHKMRSRIIEASVFRSERILGAILFEDTMERKIAGKYTADYLLDEKEILPFLKVDKGLQEKSQGVQLMNEMPDLEKLLTRANERNIFGTKMRSVIHEANANGIRAVVEQQFVEAKRISSFGLVPIVEPEVNIESPEKAEIENILLKELEGAVKQLAPDEKIILKLSIPSRENLYKPLIDHPNVLRVVALSGGYTADKANELLAKNNGMIASFSRALAQDLRVDQTDEDFERILGKAIDEIYEASIK